MTRRMVVAGAARPTRSAPATFPHAQGGCRRVTRRMVAARTALLVWPPPTPSPQLLPARIGGWVPSKVPNPRFLPKLTWGFSDAGTKPLVFGIPNPAILPEMDTRRGRNPMRFRPLGNAWLCEGHRACRTHKTHSTRGACRARRGHRVRSTCSARRACRARKARRTRPIGSPGEGPAARPKPSSASDPPTSRGRGRCGR